LFDLLVSFAPYCSFLSVTNFQKVIDDDPPKEQKSSLDIRQSDSKEIQEHPQNELKVQEEEHSDDRLHLPKDDGEVEGIQNNNHKMAVINP
jgi:hypothetical protein